MPKPPVRIELSLKSPDGNIPVTKDEKSSDGAFPQKALPRLFENSFLRFSGWLGPRRADGEPLCDLLAALGGRVFVFCETDGEAFRAFEGETRAAAWRRWRTEILDPVLGRLREAEAHVRSGAATLEGGWSEKPLLPWAGADTPVYKVAVVPDLRRFSGRFPRGRAERIASRYGYAVKGSPAGTFCAGLPRKEIPHVIDVPALEILLRELDTFPDFSDFFAEKEKSVLEMETIQYRGEENLLAYYLLGYEEKLGKHLISPPEVREAHERLAEAFREGFPPPARLETSSGEPLRGWYVHPEGNEWEKFSGSGPYLEGKEFVKDSYAWDGFVAAARRNFEEGTVIPDIYPGRVRDAVDAMAGEPRISRARLMKGIRESAPGTAGERDAEFAVFHSRDPGPEKCCVVLWFACPEGADPQTGYRLARREALEHCCVAVKKDNPRVEKAMGLAVEMPGRERGVPDDFILFDFSGWREEESKLPVVEWSGPDVPKP